MGTICKGEEAPKQIFNLPALEESQELSKHFRKKSTSSIRFAQVQRIKAANTLQMNNYKFIIPVKNSEEFIRLETPIISSYADYFTTRFPLLSTDSIHFNDRFSPLIDFCDPQSNQQFYFNFSMASENGGGQEKQFLLKVYNYKNYNDPIFTDGLYQAALYKSLDGYINSSFWLKDFFLVEKGSLNSMVFITHKYLCTLNDILLYRKAARVPYTIEQQVYVAVKILKSYSQLEINNIIHRDIRPSKIFLFDCSQKNYDEGRMSHSYELVNLQSARKLTKSQLKILNQTDEFSNEMLMTVRGTPAYSSERVANLIETDSQIGVYNYRENECTQLARTLSAIIMCNPMIQKNDERNALAKNKYLGSAIKKLLAFKDPISKIYKELQLQFNEHKMQNKINTMKISRNSPDSLLQLDIEIAKVHLPSLLMKKNKERIEEASTQCMMSLHRQSQFCQKFDKMMDINDNSGNQMENVAILDRLGRYYEGLGAKNNDYYLEEAKLLVELCSKDRINGFLTSPYLQKINTLIANKIPIEYLQNILKVKVLLEEAYEALYEKMYTKAQDFINEAMTLGSNSNIQLEVQLKLIECKILIQLEVNGPEEAEDFREKGLQLSSIRNNFTTQYEMLTFKSTFQYLSALCYLKNCSNSDLRIEELKKYLAKADSHLSHANKTKSQIPQTSVVPFGKILEAQGDMNYIKQNYPQSIKFYERVYNLYSTAQRKVSERLIIEILEKIYRIYQNNIEDLSQQNKVEERMRKYRRKSLKEVDPRKNFEKIKYLSKRRNESQKMKKSWLEEHKQSDIFREIAEENEEEERSLEGSGFRGEETIKKSEVMKYGGGSLRLQDILEENQKDKRQDQ